MNAPAALPRFSLLSGPTPLQELVRLRAALGGPERCPRIFIKRDDLAGPALGGNKSRKLEYVMGEALAQGATHLITTGATQSNHARMTAAAARMAGLSCVLVLTDPNPGPAAEGNLLLDRLLGADVRFVPPYESTTALAENPQEVAVIAQVTADLKSRGHRPYLVPLGASTPLGALGYVDMVGELEQQLRALGAKPSRLYFAAGSRGTQAGIVLGGLVHGATWKAHGVAVSPGDPAKTDRAVGWANDAAKLIGKDVRITADQVITHQEYFGEGYAIPTPESRAAIQLLLETEGVVIDPVYTSKGMAGLLDHIRRQEMKAEETVVFLHTGGIPGLFTSSVSSSYK